MSYLWLGKGHPAKQGKRLALPPNKRHRDRKNDYRRKPKHPKREEL